MSQSLVWQLLQRWKHGFYCEILETLNQCEMFSRHFVKTPICNQYCYRPVPVSNSKSIWFKIQMLLPSTMWDELWTSQIRLRWKYYKTSIMKLVSWFWLTATDWFFIWKYKCLSYRSKQSNYVLAVSNLRLSWNDLEIWNEKHWHLSAKWGRSNCTYNFLVVI